MRRWSAVLFITVMAAIVGCSSLPAAIDYLSRPPGTEVTATSGLKGFAASQELPRLTFQSWWSGQYQDQFSKWWGENFINREKYIRCSNQMYYSIFHKSYMYNQTIVIGKEHQLFEKAYIDDYVGEPAMDQQQVGALVKKIALLQELLRQRDISFTVLVTPSKAFTYPEYLPQGFAEHKVTSNYERVMAAVSGTSINVVDGQKLVLDLKKEQDHPLFCQGGTHWNDLAAYHTTLTLTRTIQKNTGWNLAPLQIDRQYVDNNPTATDKDLADLLNLKNQQWQYISPHVVLSPYTAADVMRPQVVLVGGSFCNHVINMLMSSGWASSIDFYSYYDLDFVTYPDDQARKSQLNLKDPSWWDKQILSRKVLTLEINEVHFDAAHLTRFLDDAISNLGDNHAKTTIGETL